jgi:hypothetical protein
MERMLVAVFDGRPRPATDFAPFKRSKGTAP